MVVVAMVSVIVVVVVVVKVLVGDAEIIDTVVLVERLVLADVIVSAVKFVMPTSCSVDMPSDVAVDLLMDALSRISIGVLADVNANAFASAVTALKFPMSTTLEEFSRWSTFDCRPLALLVCDRVLQTWMPSYHV